MKHIFLCLMLCCFGITGCKKTHKLAHGYRWQEKGANVSVIIDSKGKVVAGPGLIMLSAKYPFIYGTDEKHFFIINMRTDHIEILRSGTETRLKELALPSTLSSMTTGSVTFYDLLVEEARRGNVAVRFFNGITPLEQENNSNRSP